MRHDVIVVGAGLAGLTTATALADAGLDVRVLEARDRVGGRTFTKVIDGAPIDLGGEWLGPTQRRMRALCARLGDRVRLSLPELSLIHIGRCRRYAACRSRWAPYH